MLKIISANLWAMIARKLRHAASRRGAIAYVTDASVLPLQEGDLLVTDASDASIEAGRTKATVLQQYLNSGVELFSLPNLHAKVLVIDDWALVGSANASDRSAHLYVEAAVLSDRPDLVGQADRLVTALAESATPVDDSFIERILAIPFAEAPAGETARASTSRPSPSVRQRAWLVSVRGDATYPGDEAIVERMATEIQKKKRTAAGMIDWMWWVGKARFPALAQRGDVVIQCWRPRSRIRTTRGVRVFRPGRIEKVFQEPRIRARTFYCMWPADHDETAVSWSTFVQLAKRAGLTRRLTPTSTVELTPQQSSVLFEIWPR